MAEKSEIIAEIEALTVHCRPPIMDEDVRTCWLRDWCDDLAPHPISAVRLGCRSWRHSGATKFPTPGQLLPLVKANLPTPAAEQGANEPWRPLSDDEYDRLSLRDKIRHHLIAAHETSCQAGPMWKTPETSTAGRPLPGHLTAAQMSEDWHSLTARAANHLAEAAHLRSILHRRAA
jgi:hypothetical protein